jgi:hypothetical protein
LINPTGKPTPLTQKPKPKKITKPPVIVPKPKLNKQKIEKPIIKTGIVENVSKRSVNVAKTNVNKKNVTKTQKPPKKPFIEKHWGEDSDNIIYGSKEFPKGYKDCDSNGKRCNIYM